jgi:site-specific DNA recombinase
MMEEAARRYLAGESISRIADDLPMSSGTLYKTLYTRCGDKWPIKFNCVDLNIHKTFEMSVPPLLPEETIRAVLARAQANKTYEHGQIKHQYLLSRIVFCAHCGYALTGQTNHQEKRFYRHRCAKRIRPCPIPKTWVRAEAIEEAAVRLLFQAFGNPAAVERAIEQAVPDLNAARDLQERIRKLEGLIADERKGRDKVLALVNRGKATIDEASTLLDDSQKRIKGMEQKLTQLVVSAARVPSVAQVKEIARIVASKFKRVPKSVVRANAAIGVANSDYVNMTWEDKRELLKRVFGGQLPDGRRAGIYLEWPAKNDGKTVRFTIQGLCLSGSLDDATKVIDLDYVPQEAVVPMSASQ